MVDAIRGGSKGSGNENLLLKATTESTCYAGDGECIRDEVVAARDAKRESLRQCVRCNSTTHMHVQPASR